ncbi:hypothetical protein SCHPADRAFT_825102 [Schizopora paradoxa]|uniref:AB hydrolase-1 domain-containing protein n=1 Tax=Schizopora paradoxa TaxID=27342 RepID=A0A0H2S092_9AGAM|nr:hypothetical protein SCHPADRAFT_825102 [Schizopora paradoxa]
MAALISSSSSNCQNLDVSVDVTSSNIKITLPEPQSTSDLIDLTERVIALNGASNISETSTDGMQNISGTYTINAQYCVPPPESQQDSKSSTVQFLIHGVGFDKSYWDFPYDPANYSYVQAANMAGYTTFAIDRLGVGESSKPDPISAVQFASNVEVVKALTKKLRQGEIDGVNPIEKVIHVGHSFGSLISNALASEAPDLSDALVLTGYSHNSSGNGPLFDIANDVDALRFSSLPNGYLLSSSGVYGQELAFFHVGGFDQQVANLATQTAQTVTVGELLTQGQGAVPAPDFKGPVLTITGQNDQPFCAGSCYGEGYPYIIGQDAQYWPASSNFTAHTPLNTGHGLNLHYSVSKLPS